ncbi:MAG: hypothetical protein PVF58_21305 [Candidatus Methanofastidiosia archaeon]
MQKLSILNARLQELPSQKYCDENIVYFSEQKENSKKELNKEMEVKNKNRIKSYNSDEKMWNVEKKAFANKR